VAGYANLIMRAGSSPPGGTYVPIVRLPTSPDAHADVLDRLNDLSKSTKLFAANRDAYRYLLSELIDNIYEHAGASHAFVMAQAYPKIGRIEASFMDDGRTIPTSLGEGTGTAYAPQDSFRAILDALDGRSSKGGGERGYGLGSSTRIVNALGGEVLIVSGTGAVVVDNRGRRLAYSLRPEFELQGTLVGLRLSEGSKKVNLYELVER
jgi:anti-sigma regulatory factor (Ser/Thr protein kinase)